jgi:hypothetical protein
MSGLLDEPRGVLKNLASPYYLNKQISNKSHLRKK